MGKSSEKVPFFNFDHPVLVKSQLALQPSAFV